MTLTYRLSQRPIQQVHERPHIPLNAVPVCPQNLIGKLQGLRLGHGQGSAVLSLSETFSKVRQDKPVYVALWLLQSIHGDIAQVLGQLLKGGLRVVEVECL
jgi:hypothetical protein